jgi:ABC-type Na+ efflux pump permease subunit
VKAKRGFSALKLLPSIGITLIVGGLIVSYGAEINTDLKGEYSEDSTVYGIVNNSNLGLSNLGKKIPSLATIVIAGLIIAVLIGAFAFAYGRRR